MSREYTFRWDGELQVLWAGERSYPARFHRESAREFISPGDPFLLDNPHWRMETRRAVVMFENQWHLSTIWGDATYSSNSYQHLHFREPTEFIEEPELVEVGVLPSTLGLWGEPLSYVSVPEYQRLADIVMMMPYDVELPAGEWDSVDGFCDLLITAGLDKTL